ncbi:MAG: hypothetical protein IT447_10085 [Phycisphaerales bacterium]|jgi:hypothetical protein|nr:hypothetical protein [Phycisphaerales bacterium]
MTTLRQIERLWSARRYDHLFRQLMAARPESSMRLEVEVGGSAPAAALALIRLDELCQSHQPLASDLLRALLASQESDGGWKDPMTTALCLRALFTCHGAGAAIDRGLFYLANLQKSEGIWPNVPLRRLPADPFVSAFILYQLGENPGFRAAVRFIDALNWFEHHESSLDPESRRLWDRAITRCRLGNSSQSTLTWS